MKFAKIYFEKRLLNGDPINLGVLILSMTETKVIGYEFLPDLELTSTDLQRKVRCKTHPEQTWTLIAQWPYNNYLLTEEKTPLVL